MKGIKEKTEKIEVVDPDIISQLEGEQKAIQYSKSYAKLDVLDLEAVRNLKKTIDNPENKYYQSLALLESNNKLIHNVMNDIYRYMSNEYEVGMSILSPISWIVILGGIISIICFCFSVPFFVDLGGTTVCGILVGGVILLILGKVSEYFGRLKRKNNVKKLILLSEKIVEHGAIEDIIAAIYPIKYFEILSELYKEQLPPMSSLQRRLGACYDLGYGVEENIDAALDWYSEAANNRKPDMRACKFMKDVGKQIATSYQQDRDSQDFIDRGIGKAWRWLSGESEMSDEEQNVLNSVQYYTEKYEELKREYDRLCRL